MDAEKLLLSVRRVRTPEGVRKYRQPIGTIIRPDLVPSFRDNFETPKMVRSWGDREPDIEAARNKATLTSIFDAYRDQFEEPAYSEDDLEKAPIGYELEYRNKRGDVVYTYVRMETGWEQNYWREYPYEADVYQTDSEAVADNMNTQNEYLRDTGGALTRTGRASYLSIPIEKFSDAGAELAEIYNFSHGDLDVMLEDASISVHWNEDRRELVPHLHVNMLVSGHGEVGKVQRSIEVDSDGVTHAQNILFELPEAQQRKGLGYAYNEHLENWYIANGVKYVRVETGLSAGGFVWARNGFDWDTRAYDLYESGPPPVEEIADWISEALEDRPEDYGYTETELLDLHRKLEDIQGRASFDMEDEDYPTPYELSQFGWREGLKLWPGKEFMMGSKWRGRKDLIAPLQEA